MKTLKITILAAVLAFGINADAAETNAYNITFTGGGNVGSGQILVADGLAVGGYFEVTAGIASGTSWILYTAGGATTYPSFIQSPDAEFNYNNAVYLTGNPQYPIFNPYLDDYGLLFVSPNPLNTDELNLFGNADGGYTFDAFLGGNLGSVVGVSTITPAPEPSSLAVFAIMLIPVGAIFYQRRIKADKSGN